MAGQERHAAEHTGIITDHIVEIGVVTGVARIQTEAGDLVDRDAAGEVRADADRTATGDTAAAFHAAVQKVDVFRKLRIHRFFLLAEIDLFGLHVNPRFHAFAHVAHPLTGIDREVTDQFERRQRSKREFRGKVTGERTAGKAGLTVDHHGAGTADTGAADEVKLQRRILRVTQFVQQNVDLEHTVLLFNLSTHFSSAPRNYGRGSSMRSLRPCRRLGSRLW